MDKNKLRRLIKESVAETLKDQKEKSIDNQIEKAKALLTILHSEIGAYTTLAKEAANQYKEHEYEKLMAEHNRLNDLAEKAKEKYYKVEIKLKELETDKKSLNKKSK